MPISEDLLGMLVCPACKGDLEYDRVNARFICHACRLRYPIEGDIANFLIESAERFDPDPNPKSNPT
jgi:uncharacterized protein YbaR (Trm112 family)